ncbi:MAG: winged helix-turn-helix transcriptional regulator [archaeon]
MGKVPKKLPRENYPENYPENPCLKRKTIQKDKVTEKEKTREKTREKIIELMAGNPKITVTDLAKKIGISVKGIEWQTKQLKKEKTIKRIGPDKGGHWEVKKR